ncbi:MULTISPECIES: DUF2905 domain-containing protein [unclassified Carboxydocella]|uniref:DUF2905 domain-containing protein n=1 Tax=unclassified Carboxydocella TaxID=2685367 RepID=UPI0009AF1C7A|nr:MULTISPECIES: DUF2905 domain-containing protein [unclassified Carboxydocella]AVX31963.1 Protein of unknown function (DUF2905) [Carboxydocella thermautotrophica]GAW29220.1 hypothetical protein ULO1_17900 [Carboxydocella sp. ULO1]GAW32606.1 hypothetical protein JDF658_23710 [Carboxydocella sp. JDF658]
MGKWLMGTGLFLVGAGLLIWLMEKILPAGRLPGDIYIQKGNFTFYFPLATSIVISIILTLLLNLLFRR